MKAAVFRRWLCSACRTASEAGVLDFAVDLGGELEIELIGSALKNPGMLCNEILESNHKFRGVRLECLENTGWNPVNAICRTSLYLAHRCIWQLFSSIDASQMPGAPAFSSF